MPTPDASQFTQMKKFQAIQARIPGISDKINTHLSQPVPTASGLPDFLPSFSNKITSSTPNYVPINIVTGRQTKPKVPGGNVNGETGGDAVICGVIDITDIATYDVVNSRYELNGNYTITACQILSIAVGITLQINGGQTLTNNGTINNSGTLRNAGTLRNNGIFNNNGTLNNNLDVFNNNTLNNNGTFNNNPLGNIFNNSPGRFNNISILKNTGNSYNDLGATINNSGFIYTYGGGKTYNDSTLNNTGTISTSTGSPCGVGTLTNNGTITGTGTQNTVCPP